MSSQVSELELAGAYARCADIVRSRARNFWYGLRLMPEPKRSALYAVYAWMRMVDDVVDEGDGLGDRVAQLESIRTRTHEIILNGLRPKEPTWMAFADMVGRYEPPLKCFDEMIDGQLSDLTWTSCPDWATLELFCRRVASTVGLICVRVWGYEDPRVEQFAVDRGIAFQLTNILRDLREDAERNRCYLPETELEAAGLDLPGVLAWSDPERCRAFMLEQVRRARAHYDASDGIEDLISRDSRPTSWAMTRIYRGLLDKIERDPSRVVGQSRIRVGSLKKAAIALHAKLQGAGVAGS